MQNISGPGPTDNLIRCPFKYLLVSLSGSHETSANQLSVSLYRRIATKGREENCSSGTGVDSFTLPGQLSEKVDLFRR